MKINPFETITDLRNIIFEKSEQLVNICSALNGSRFELMDFAEDCKCSDDFHKWLVSAAMMRTSESIIEMALLCNQIFDILGKCDEALAVLEGDDEDVAE